MATQPSGKAAPDLPRYLHTAEVADILHVSPKTVSRWAKEDKLPFLKTLGGAQPRIGLLRVLLGQFAVLALRHVGLAPEYAGGSARRISGLAGVEPIR